MIFRTLLLTLASASVMAPTPMLHADIIIEENFDSDLYTDGAPLVKDGESSTLWKFNNLKGGSVETTSEVALSQPRAAALKVFDEGDQAQVLAMLPQATISASAPIGMKVAFNCRHLGAPAYFMVRDEAGETISLVTVQSSGAVQVAFEPTGGRIVNLGAITEGEWFYIDFQLPAIPSDEGASYQASLLAADGETVIGRASGLLFSNQSSGNYAYFSAMVAAQGEAAISETVIDNLSITTTKDPEP